MSKCLIAKLSMTVAALGALALLPGCSKEVNSAVLETAWLPVGSQLPLGTEFVPIVNGGAGTSAGGGAGAGGGGQPSSGTPSQ